MLHDLDVQVGELSTLATEVVDLARVETTREQPEPVELTELFSAAVDRVRIRAPRITFTADMEPVTVQGRPGELERVVVNVLDNAANGARPVRRCTPNCAPTARITAG
ncbi:hypothetical protein [Actinophytocola sp.]|uniref:hypothetical protein n=1 Tax=Actinophytocola sp. TaxID=1872138 RepID=UPI002D7F6B2B|nr:hypothetical protein [Actinophytocola sp.]HET9138563.1 hypothetical protein [Actinophytocola sp.]